MKGLMFDFYFEDKEAVFRVCRHLWALRENFFEEYSCIDIEYKRRVLKNGVIRMLVEEYERVEPDEVTPNLVDLWYGMLVLSVVYGIGTKRFKRRENNLFFQKLAFCFLPNGPYEEFYEGFEVEDQEDKVIYVFPREGMFEAVYCVSQGGFFTFEQFDDEEDGGFAIFAFSPFLFCELGKKEALTLCWPALKFSSTSSWEMREEVYINHELETSEGCVAADFVGEEHVISEIGFYERHGISRKIFLWAMREVANLGVFEQRFMEENLEEFLTKDWEERLFRLGYLDRIGPLDVYLPVEPELVLLPALEDR